MPQSRNDYKEDEISLIRYDTVVYDREKQFQLRWGQNDIS